MSTPPPEQQPVPEHVVIVGAGVGGITLPTTIDLGEPQPGDEDLGVLIVRRTTLETIGAIARTEEDTVDV